MTTIAGHFQSIDRDQLQVEWAKIKYDMFTWRKSKQVPEEHAVEWCLKKVMQLEHFYPALSQVTGLP